MGYFVVKVCLVGSSGAGKTCIALRYAQNTYKDGLPSTIGAMFFPKKAATQNGTHYQLQLWDTAGQERFRAIVPLYYRGAAVVLVVFDLTSRRSFTDSVPEWIRLIGLNSNINDMLMVIVGNKLDLNDLREVDKEEGKNYAQRIGALYWETSAKTGANIDQLFADICSNLERNGNKNLKYVPRRDSEENSEENPPSNESPSKKSCCN